MSKAILHLHFLSLFLLCCVCHSSIFTLNFRFTGIVACRPHQIQAFTKFTNEFDTRGCNNSDTFNGVWCDNSTGAVAVLQLRKCLSGTLKSNSSLFGFHQLRYVDLQNNNLTSSSLPSGFGNLKRLEGLFLSSNGFLGQVPSSFSNLTMLAQLDLSYNKLTGSFPLVRGLRKLIVLDLSYNHFSGTLNPNSSLFELHQLRYLNLAFNNFSSSLPSKFGNLHRLENLILSSNGFSGQVPSTISNLTRLTKLYLDQNKLTSSFPLVQNLTNLSELDLSYNKFFGVIPSSLLTLPFLAHLALRENNLAGSVEVSNSSTSSRLEIMYLGSNHFEGQILEPISKLINLKHLDLSFLNTSYPIDLKLFSSLKSLRSLDLSGNSISSASLSSDSYIPLTLEMLTLRHCDINEFPNILKTLKELVYIDISNNRMKGKIPEWLWSLPLLQSVTLGNNYFTGFQGSAEILVNSSVLLLYLDSNNFEGALPDLPLSIKGFGVASNSFTSEIPLSICNRSSLAAIDLSYNNFTGPIPPCLRNLELVYLRNNNLEGSIPDALCDGASLRTLDVSHNRLTGKLPRSFVNCSSLKFLSVINNRIEDTFPFWLKALPNLQVLTLRSNRFYGPISPPHQGPLGFPELRIFEISDNKFTGSLPPNYFVNWKASSRTMNQDGGLYMVYEEKLFDEGGYGYTDALDLQYKGLHMEQAKALTSYAAIDFSGNRLEGQIPESIGLLKALIAVNISNNAFTGHIPLSMANLENLESLDMSRNQLSGTIPNGLGSISFLAYINVSHNQLTGEIPQGTQITGQSKSSFEGNAGLCGLPLKESCFGTGAPPMYHQKQEDKEEEEEEEEEEAKTMASMAGPDHLFNLRNHFYLGAYQAAINNSEIPNLSQEDIVERDCLVHRAYIALGSYQLVISEIDEAAATPLQAVKLLAMYLSSPENKESTISSLREWLADPTVGNNAIIRLIAGTIFMHEEDYNEALKHTHSGGTMDLHALNVQIFIKMHRSDFAEKQLRVMQQIDEDHTLTQLASAWLNLAVGGSKIQEAYLIFQDFSEKYPMTSLILNGKAVCCMHMGNFEEAETLLLEALNKDAKDPETLANLVVCSLHVGKSSSRYLNQLKLSHPEHVLVKRAASAEDNFERALQSFA